MPKVIVDLDKKEEKIIREYKFYNNIKRKDIAIKEIIRRYKDARK